MKKTQKIVIMISVLLAPIFVFLFLKEYGINKFEVPVYYPEGNPITECKDEGKQHQLTIEILFENNIGLPALIYIPSLEQNEYYSDLNNVLAKYPAVDLIQLINKGSSYNLDGIKPLLFDSLSYLNYINCELILGEDHLLSKPIASKYVLVDNRRMIRGYYNCNDLDDIERLDVELDILLNY